MIIANFNNNTIKNINNLHINQNIKNKNNTNLMNHKIKAISLILMIWLHKKLVIPWYPTLWYLTINNKKANSKKDKNIISKLHMPNKLNNKKNFKNMSTKTKVISVTSTIWHHKKWVNPWSLINKTCLLNINNIHQRNNKLEKNLKWNKTSLTRNKVQKNNPNKKNNLKWTYNNLVNKSQKIKVTTSLNLTKCKMNKWVPQWCPINNMMKMNTK